MIVCKYGMNPNKGWPNFMFWNKMLKVYFLYFVEDFILMIINVLEEGMEFNNETTGRINKKD